MAGTAGGRVIAELLALVSACAVWRLLVRRPFPHRVPGLANRSGSQALRGVGAPDARPPRRALGSVTAVRRGPDRPVSARPSTRGRLRSPGPRADGSGGGDGPEDLVVCIDLLGVAVGAGHSIPDAIRAVADAEGGTLARELDRVARALDRGSTTAAALDELPLRLGPSVAPLTGALLSTLGSGAPAAHMLHRLADAERRRLRHRTEARLRRLPVLLTVPLVVFVLPAFVVMTLVPVAVTVAGGLDRPSIAGS